MNDSPVVRAETPRTSISSEERARRRAAIDYARTSLRLEGFALSAFAEDANRRYIDGEIDSKEHSAAIRAHYRQ